MIHLPSNSPEHALLLIPLASISLVIYRRRVFIATLISIPVVLFGWLLWPHLAPHQALIWKYIKPMLMTLSLAAPILIIMALRK